MSNNLYQYVHGINSLKLNSYLTTGHLSSPPGQLGSGAQPPSGFGPPPGQGFAPPTSQVNTELTLVLINKSWQPNIVFSTIHSCKIMV